MCNNGENGSSGDATKEGKENLVVEELSSPLLQWSCAATFYPSSPSILSPSTFSSHRRLELLNH